ncbi:aryl-alcohol dehydrogenase-like predicted oxidoreductase [Kitasatospora sp. SolWspMP-SS2h]|uniref:aldo/keto reductase n=1 Tax=Kitasatospora sp. SolWspMP-SS2h TaxID=1305729 RepID=UPI000DB909C6|nr:aldo/keto reductase [Kitasatospora sp. SolWspMP-SS2h]RAJ32095.1 aryl-alcohol dehydrogenase-like predicted oxidoreductase [Kitasatospora sp. SolWspMP-SS2h]
MEYRQLGNCGLRVSVLSLGTMTFGGRGVFAKVGGSDVLGATRLVDRALDAGVNLVDTADSYSGGLSEEIVGRAMKGRWNRALVATKARMPTGTGPNDAGLSRHHLIEACEGSLRRLGTDHIDLYQVHAWDGCTPLEETLRALDDLVRAGKVRYVGCSNYSGWHLMKALATADRLGTARFVSQQIHYSLQARDAENELLPIAVDQGVGVLAWSPLAGGLLTGKYRRGTEAPAGSRHLSDWNEPPVHDREQLYDIVETLVQIAGERGATPAQVALAWLLGRPAVSSLVVGARTEEQLAGNLAAAELVLSEGERERLAQVSAPPLPYPYWHQAKIARDRLGAADLALLGPRIAPR